MDVFVGTSGWYYEWNADKTLDWYVAHAGLPAIELNTSYYGFPHARQVPVWAKKGSKLRWAVKVNRLITHQYRFGDAALPYWRRFRDLFVPLEPSVGFYLFQAPPHFTHVRRLVLFLEAASCDGKCAVELRNPHHLGNDPLIHEIQQHAVAVSVDSPDFQNRIFPGDTVYLRMHGRTDWYSHRYSAEELAGTAEKIRENGPKQAYIFFNNDHAMLDNAKAMLAIFTG
jgi:uncharacterized protein YecE (DUF72 family)